MGETSTRVNAATAPSCPPLRRAGRKNETRRCQRRGSICQIPIVSRGRREARTGPSGRVASERSTSSPVNLSARAARTKSLSKQRGSFSYGFASCTHANPKNIPNPSVLTLYSGTFQATRDGRPQDRIDPDGLLSYSINMCGKRSGKVEPLKLNYKQKKNDASDISC